MWKNRQIAIDEKLSFMKHMRLGYQLQVSKKKVWLRVCEYENWYLVFAY